MLRKLWYVPLEAYENRYTYQLLEWSTRQFKELGINFEVVHGKSLHNAITMGQVLDAFGRPYYALAQIQTLLIMASNETFSCDDFILFEDMFHPGIESLAYAFNQMKYAGKEKHIPKIGMRCLAQTVDPDDFVHYTGMARWMRHYEKMVNSFITCLFVASKEMLGYIKAAGWEIPCYVTGLPFCTEEVQDRATNTQDYITPFDNRPLRISFASRIAKEKNIDFLVQFARMAYALDSRTEFVILSGSEISRDWIKMYFPKLFEAEHVGIISIHDGLSKEQYYNELMKSRVLFNCSYQDWISNTASEADALGCNLLFPAYRSFPEAFNNDHTRLYVPWSYSDALTKLKDLMSRPHSRQGQFAGTQNATNFKTIRFIQQM